MAVFPNGTKVEPTVSSNYGPRDRIWTGSSWTSPFHYGVDYINLAGDQVKAVMAGTVIAVGVIKTWEGAGIQVYIDHGGKVYSRSFHLARATVSAGQQVSEGQLIGIQDSTGAVTGKHLHLQIHVGGGGNANAVDPRAYIKARLGSFSGGAVAGNQRVAGPNGANRREQPTSKSPIAGDPLAPGTVGNFVGWINGESVEGNPVWFKGTSGNWFWSGGFTDKGTHDLENLNPAPALGPQQRKTTTDLHGRAEPNTKSAINQTLAAGTIGNFVGWITGEAVGTENRWLKGISGDWFSLTYLEPRNVDNLPNLNPVAPTPDGKRTTGPNSSNGRLGPSTDYTVVESIPANTVAEFDGYAHGQSVEGNDIWFRRVGAKRWYWSGGFTSKATTGLALITDIEPPQQTQDPNNPRNLQEYVPLYPEAIIGIKSPLGDGSRATKGTPGVAVDRVRIDRYIIHWTATLVDQVDYFSYKNDRSVCPTWYMRRNGDVLELIPPQMKPAVTGSEWNYRSLATETLAQPGSDFTPEQWEAHAQIIAWIASYNGKELDTIPVEFTIDREHIIGHREALPGTTTCPGDTQIAGLDKLITRAKVIYAEKYAPVTEQITVDKAWLKNLMDNQYSDGDAIKLKLQG